MHPVLTSVQVGAESRVLGSYGACLALAILLGCALTLWRASRTAPGADHDAEHDASHDAGNVIAVLGCTVLSGFFGAYALSVLVRFQLTGSIEHALATPGLVFYGGALCGALGFVQSARAFGVHAASLADASVPGLPLAHALGRIGCFLGGCCFGREHDGLLAVTYTHALAPAAHSMVPRHPWPLYEAAALLVLSAWFARAPKPSGRAAPGSRFAAYACAYAVVRALLEPLRGDTVRGTFSLPVFDAAIALSTSQLVSGFVVLASGMYLWTHARAFHARDVRV
jgi:phosphatidylglycerol:prolipoprotein diacylglycerol transferase